MIDVLEKQHTQPNNPQSLFVKATLDSVHNGAVHLVCPVTENEVVVFDADIDALIEILQYMKRKYL